MKERMMLEDIHGFVVITEDVYEDSFAGKTALEKTLQIFRMMADGGFFAPTERQALDLAKQTYGTEGTRFYLLPIDFTIDCLEGMPYRFEEHIIAVPHKEMTQ